MCKERTGPAALAVASCKEDVASSPRWEARVLARLNWHGLRFAREKMKSKILLEAALVIVLSAESAFAQEARNAARKVEITYTGNIPLFSYVARTFRLSHFVRKEGPNLLGACVQVAVKVMDSGAVVGELCGTHQFFDGKQVDSLHSLRGGMRFSNLAGSHTTTFLQGLAGFESGYRHGGFANDSGVSLAVGGGVDFGLKNWLGLELARANYQMTRVSGTTVNSLRFDNGFVFRMGEIADQSTGLLSNSPAAPVPSNR